MRFIIRAVDGCGNDVAYDEVDSIEAVLRSLVSMNLGTLRTGQRIEITRQVTRKGDDKMMPRWTSVTPEWLPRAVEEAAQP